MKRNPLPPRRKSVRQAARIDGQKFYLTFGHYPDGTLGEIFVDASKQGTFLRGVLDALARTVSLALQCGATVAEVAHTLRDMDFPPRGDVEGSASVAWASSLADWIGREMEAAYTFGPSDPSLLESNP